MQPQKFKEVLLEDAEFFELYRDTFLKKISEIGDEKEKEEPLRFEEFLNLCGNVYDILFSQDKNLKEIYSIFEKILFDYTDLVKYLIAALAHLVCEYSIFVSNKELHFEKLYAIYTLYSFLFFTLNKIYEKVEKQKEEEIKKVILKELQAIKERFNIKDEKLLKEVLLSLLGEVEQVPATFSVKEIKKKTVKKVTESMEEGERILQNVEEIFRLLKEVKEKDNKLELRTYFKGLPVFCVVSISDLDPSMNMVMLEAKHCKYKIFYTKGQEVFLHNNILPLTIKGKVFKGDPDEGVLIISDLRFEEDRFARRKYVRVEVEQPVKVELLAKGKKYFGLLKDISQRGAAIKFKGELPPLEEGNMLKIKIPLEEEGEIETLAIVRRMDPEEQIVGVEFQLPYLEEKKLIQYILQKQQEILNNLKF